MAGVGTKGGLPAPDVLNYGGPGTNRKNRPPALAWAQQNGIVAGPGQSLDEYPFASTTQGGVTDWLKVAPVATDEQDLQGGALRTFYGSKGFTPFRFLVVLVV
jgi:hypothetical protein